MSIENNKSPCISHKKSKSVRKNYNIANIQINIGYRANNVRAYNFIVPNMLAEVFKTALYIGILFSLFFVDYVLGNGLVEIFKKLICNTVCFVRKTLREEAKQHLLAGTENPISLPVLFVEILVLSLTLAFLQKCKTYRGKDRMDDLLHESKEALRQTNEFLEKWRLRRVPTEYSYLDEEPQEIDPFKLEVPILHMAIIDTLGTTRSQPERGDAGDTINITDSTLLSVTSLIDEDLELHTESNNVDKNIDEHKNIEFSNRFLWDVMEEDASNLED